MLFMAVKNYTLIINIHVLLNSNTIRLYSSSGMLPIARFNQVYKLCIMLSKTKKFQENPTCLPNNTYTGNN